MAAENLRIENRVFECRAGRVILEKCPVCDGVQTADLRVHAFSLVVIS